MGRNFYFIVAQILGLFPVGGIWGSNKTAADLTYQKCSIVSLYSFILLMVRLAVKLAFLMALYAWTAMKVPSKTDFITAVNTYINTFSTGCIYQFLVLVRTKRFVILWQKLEQYDAKYPKSPSTNKRSQFWGMFPLSNLIFAIFTIGFPAVVFAKMLLLMAAQAEKIQDKGFKNLNETEQADAIMLGFQEKYYKGGGGLHSPLSLTIGFLVMQLIVEAATVFPIFQLNYLVKAVETRLNNIYIEIRDYPRMKMSAFENEYDLLLSMYTSEKWVNKKLLAQFGRANQISPKNGEEMRNKNPDQFWTDICKQYLDYHELFETFLNFSGLFFITIFPLQMLSVLGILYLNTTTPLFKDNDYVAHSMNVLASLGTMRTWSLCNLGHQIELIRMRILTNVLRVDSNLILTKSERISYKKFVQIVRSIPIQLNASGFFNVSRSNIPAILTALVSYFIILLQFKGSESPGSMGTLNNFSLQGMNNWTWNWNITTTATPTPEDSYTTSPSSATSDS